MFVVIISDSSIRRECGSTGLWIWQTEHSRRHLAILLTTSPSSFSYIIDNGFWWSRVFCVVLCFVFVLFCYFYYFALLVFVLRLVYPMLPVDCPFLTVPSVVDNSLSRNYTFKSISNKNIQTEWYHQSISNTTIF